MTAPVIPTISTSLSASGTVLDCVPMTPALHVIRCSELVPDPVRWVLTEETVPESSPHDLMSERIRGLLRGWADRTGRRVKIGRNLAIRWDRKRPQFGLDPDVYLVEPPPPEGDAVLSLKLWKKGHVAPQLAVEIVSASHPNKDYVIAPQKYAASGVLELWVLDPRLEGPKSHSGPHLIQIWRRLDDVSFAQIAAGEGPAWSEVVKGWIHAVPAQDGHSFDLTSDETGHDRWLTPEEAALSEAEAARKQAEAARKQAEAAKRAIDDERNAREAAERRVRELEALLARGR